MLGTLSKQVAGLTFLPFGLWVLAAAFGRSTAGGRRRWRLLFFFLAGSLLPLALVVARYAVAGELRTFWYYLVTYNVEVYMAPLKGVSRMLAIGAWFRENLVLMTLALTGVAWSLGRLAVASLRARSLAAGYLAVGFQVTVALTAVVSVVGAHFALRGFGHYYVQAVPWFALLAGVVVESAREPDSPAGSETSAAGPGGSRGLALYHALVLLPMIVVSEVVWAPKRAGLGPQVAGVKPSLICPVAQQYARPEDRIFIWGFYSEAHIWCRRKPATRYVFSTFVAGFVPWFHNLTRAQEDALAVPGSRAQLIAELEAGKTPVILDAHVSMGHRPMRRYEELARYLDDHYRWVTRVDQVDVYLRGKRNRRELFDFKGPNLDPEWALQGDAFRGTDNIHHPPQGPILGQVGQRFLNSFTAERGDAATGVAVSPAFRIDRARLGFLVGGGRSCKVLLRIDGRDVLEQTGYDTTQFHDVVWDVSAYQGKEARLVLIDQAIPIWGHLLLDRVELFDPP